MCVAKRLASDIFKSFLIADFAYTKQTSLSCGCESYATWFSPVKSKRRCLESIQRKFYPTRLGDLVIGKKTKCVAARRYSFA